LQDAKLFSPFAVFIDFMPGTFSIMQLSGCCRIANSMEQFFQNKLKHTSLRGGTPKKLNSLRSVDFNGFFKAYGDSTIPFPRQILFEIAFYE